MLDKVAEAGLNFIDTADMYPPGAEVGTSERITGRWLGSKRGQFILGTIGGDRMGSAAWDQASSTEVATQESERSLARSMATP
jgi:aryl-alcohol dehydrogenase-like predicted oxidoreductase